MPLPNAEPIGLPAPVWLLQALLVLTFSLHLIPMTFTLGGSLLGLYHEVMGRVSPGSYHRQLAGRLWALLPSITAFTITLGVAPLLFVQLVYGKFFYPASILTGWSWFAVVPILIVGYSMLYAQAMGSPKAWWRPWAGAVAFLSFLAVMAIYVSTMSLTTEPQLWKEMYAQTQGGTHWFFQAPRGLHILLGALMMAGALAALIGHLSEGEFGRFARVSGCRWLVGATVVQLPAAWWWYSVQTSAAREALLPVLLVAAGVLAVLGVALFFLGNRRAERSPLLGWLGMGALTLGAVALAIQRHLVRQAKMAPHITPADWKLSPQWDVFLIFGVLLVVTLALIGYLLVRFLKEEPGNAQSRAA